MLEAFRDWAAEQDPLAGATIVLALATAALAFFTWRLASATYDMAVSTRRMVEIEESRRVEETAADVIISQWEYALDTNNDEPQIEIHNVGTGTASAITVWFSREGWGGTVARERLRRDQREVIRGSEWIGTSAPSHLPRSGNALTYAQVEWYDVRGRHRSPVYLLGDFPGPPEIVEVAAADPD